MKTSIILLLMTVIGLGTAGRSDTPNLCEMLIDDECYWTIVHEIRDVNYKVASSLCKAHRSIVAQIPSEEVYNEVMKNIRSKIPEGRSWTVIWTGIEMDPRFNKVLSPDVYVNWFPRLPWKHNGAITTFTNVYLEVKRMKDSIYQGMLYREPRAALRGVVCRKN